MARALAALLAVALAFAALIVALGLHRHVGSPLIAGGAVFALVLCCGMPVLVLFCKRQWWQPWRFVGGGALGGAIGAIPFAGNVGFSPIYLILVLMVAGLGAGTALWCIGIWRNDNLTCPKEFRLPGGTVYKVASGALRRRLA